MVRLVAISFRAAGKLYDFAAGEFELNPGDRVIVETDRGRSLGTVIHAPREVGPEEVPPGVKSVLRPATEEDLELARHNADREQEAYRFCLNRIRERQMEMKLVRAEYLYDGSKIVFYFTAEGRVDFRELVRDLAHHFRTRIEMRQIGVRDEAKQVGGLGVCGLQLCCCTFLRGFAPISVKMAKEQGLALNPTKISGQCGRLLCCLDYEFETYCSLRKGMPKVGKKIPFEAGTVEVMAVDVIGQKFTARFGDGSRREITVDQLQQDQLRREQQGDTPPPPASAGGGQRPQKRRERSQRCERCAKPERPEGGDKPATPAEKRPTPPQGPPAEGGDRPARRRRPRRRGRRKPNSNPNPDSTS